MKPLTLLEWTASVLSIAGSLFLAIKGDTQVIRLVAFSFYLVANTMFVALFHRKKLYGAMVMNIVFLVISGIGIYNNIK